MTQNMEAEMLARTLAATDDANLPDRFAGIFNRQEEDPDLATFGDDEGPGPATRTTHYRPGTHTVDAATQRKHLRKRTKQALAWITETRQAEDRAAKEAAKEAAREAREKEREERRRLRAAEAAATRERTRASRATLAARARGNPNANVFEQLEEEFTRRQEMQQSHRADAAAFRNLLDAAQANMIPPGVTVGPNGVIDRADLGGLRPNPQDPASPNPIANTAHDHNMDYLDSTTSDSEASFNNDNMSDTEIEDRRRPGENTDQTDTDSESSEDPDNPLLPSNDAFDYENANKQPMDQKTFASLALLQLRQDGGGMTIDLLGKVTKLVSALLGVDEHKV